MQCGSGRLDRVKRNSEGNSGEVVWLAPREVVRWHRERDIKSRRRASTNNISRSHKENGPNDSGTVKSPLSARSCGRHWQKEVGLVPGSSRMSERDGGYRCGGWKRPGSKG